MKRGVSESFDEHEIDTAQRAYSKEMVEGAKRTTKMAAFNPDTPRTESGTRPILANAAIEQHVREKIEHTFAESLERSTASIEHVPIEQDPHSRPTIEAGFLTTTSSSLPPRFDLTPLPLAEVDVVVEPPPASTGVAPRETPTAVAPTSSALAAASVPSWAIAVALFGLVLLVTAAGTIGFFLGRLPHP